MFKLIAVLMITIFSLSAHEIHLSPKGSDNADGSFKYPIKSLREAQQRLRKIRRQLPQENVKILLHKGSYNLAETLILSHPDSNADAKTEFIGMPDQEIIIKSTARLKNWRLAKATELPKEIHHLIGQIWLHENSAIQNGKLRFNQLYQNDKAMPRSRKGFCYATPFEPSKIKFRQLSQEDYREKNFISEPQELKSFGIKGRNRFAKNELCAYLFFKKDELKNWSNLQDIELFMHTRAEWMYEVRGIRKVDALNNRAFFDIPTAFSTTFCKWNIHKNDRDKKAEFFIENAPEFIRKPGDWCVNTTSGTVLLYSLSKPQNIEVPRNSELIRIEGDVEGLNQSESSFTDKPIHNITFKNLIFEKANRYRWRPSDKAIHVSYDLYDIPASLLRFRGAQNCRVEACEFRNSGGSAIRFDLFAQNNTITNNAIHHMGRSGISLIGYPLGEKDVNKNNSISNNHIHHIGQIEYNAMAIAIVQSGHNKISNNLIHDTPFMGIATLGHWRWNMKGFKRPGLGTVPQWGMTDGSNTMEKSAARNESKKRQKYRSFTHARHNIISHNEVFRAAMKLGDCNPIYINTCGAGNKILHNFVHDSMNPHASTALRTDDGVDNTTISHNIVYNCMGGIAVKCRGNIYENNFMIFAKNPGPSFKGAIKVLCSEATKTLFQKKIRKNITFMDFPSKKIGYFKTYWPAFWLRSKKEFHADTAKAFSMQNDQMINDNFFYNPKQKIQLPTCLGSGSAIIDPQFKNPEEFDFTVQNTTLLKEKNIQQLNVNTMGITDDFPKHLRSPHMRLIKKTFENEK